LNDPDPFSSPVHSDPYFAVLSLLQTSLETKIERQHERNETKRGRKKSAKWRKTNKERMKEVKGYKDGEKRRRERVVGVNKERNSMSSPGSSCLP
jgi:1,4-alpha-glucan branching enzyme